MWGRRRPVRHASDTDELLLRKAIKRVSRMSDTDLLDWADSACSGMGKGFTDYRRHGELDSLGEIGLALITLQAVVLTLKERVET